MLCDWGAWKPAGQNLKTETIKLPNCISKKKPEELADIIVDNTDFENLILLKNTLS